MKIISFVELDVVIIHTVIIPWINLILVFKGTLVINQDAWNLVMSIQVVMTLISIVILIFKFVVTNVPMVIIVVKDTIAQVLANVSKLVKIVKIVLKDNIVTKKKSIAK